jgi:hypothetical protein
MSSPLPQPRLTALEDLLRRYDGPVPTEQLLCSRMGEPPDLLRLRAISREIDRMALALGRSLAAQGQELRLSPSPLRIDGPAGDELSDRLARYRTLGLHLARLSAACYRATPR